MSTGCGRGFVGLLSPPGSGVLAVAFQEDFGPVGPMLVGEEPQKLNNAGKAAMNQSTSHDVHGDLSRESEGGWE